MALQTRLGKQIGSCPAANDPQNDREITPCLDHLVNPLDLRHLARRGRWLDAGA